jgi:GGDEF domain-containing protein/DNA-binding transcriptional MerR regulator
METKMAMAVEANAALDYMNRLWNRDGSIPKLPDTRFKDANGENKTLRDELTAIDKKLPEYLMAAMEACRSKDDIRALISGVESMAARRQVEPYLSEVAQGLGIPLGDLKSRLEQVGVISKLNNALRQGVSVADAFGSITRDVQKVIWDNHQERLIAEVGKGEALMKAEGLAGVAGPMRDFAWAHDEFWTRHFAEMEGMFENASKMRGQERSAYIRETMDRQRAEWQTHNTWEKATLAGMLGAMGFGDGSAANLDPNATRYMAEFTRQHDNWEKFYSERDRLQRQFFKDTKNMPFGEPDYLATYQKLQQELGKLYDQHTRAELEAVKSQGVAFLDMWKAKYGEKDLPGAAYWWEGMVKTTTERQALMASMRAWERGEPATHPKVLEATNALTPDQRHTAWPAFLEKAYLPTIGELTHSWMDGLQAVSDSANGMKARADYSQSMAYWDQVRAERAVKTQTSPATLETPQRELRSKYLIDKMDKALADLDDVQAAVQHAQDVSQAESATKKYTAAAETPTSPDQRRPEFAWMRAQIDEQAARIAELSAKLDAARTDKITGLPKSEEYSAEIDAAPLKAFIDLNGLKYVNDTYGHAAGDALLQSFSITAQEQGITIYRRSGDEFIATFQTAEDAQARMQAFEQAYREAQVWGEAGGKPIITRGWGFSYGVGDTVASADAQNNAAKNMYYKDTGIPRGGRPPALVEEDGSRTFDLSDPDQRLSYMTDVMRMPKEIADNTLVVDDFLAENFSKEAGIALDEFWDARARRGLESEAQGGELQFQRQAAEAGTPRGAWDSINRAMIAFEKRDADTWRHEFTHLYMDNMRLYLPERYDAVMKVFDNDPEKVARAHETYSATGTLPEGVPGHIKTAFYRFRDFLRGVLDRILGRGKLPYKPTPEQVREIVKWYVPVEDAPAPEPVEVARQLANGEPTPVEHVDLVPDEGPGRVLANREVAKEYGVTVDRHLMNILRRPEYGGDPSLMLHQTEPEQVRAILEARKAAKEAEAAQVQEAVEAGVLPEQPPAMVVPEPEAPAGVRAADVVQAVEGPRVIARTAPRESYSTEGGEFYTEYAIKRLKGVEIDEYVSKYGVRELYKYIEPYVTLRRRVDAREGIVTPSEWDLLDVADGPFDAANFRDGWYLEAESVDPLHEAFKNYRSLEVELNKLRDYVKEDRSGKSPIKTEFNELYIDRLRQSRLLKKANEGTAPPDKIKAIADEFKSQFDVKKQEVEARISELEQEMEGIKGGQYLFQSPAAGMAGVSVQRFTDSMEIAGKPVIGAAYVDGQFAAYIPWRHDVLAKYDTAEGTARLLGINPDGDWVHYIEATGEVRTLPANPDGEAPVLGPMLPDSLAAGGGIDPDPGQLYADGWQNHIQPILDSLQARMSEGAPITPGKFNLDQLSPQGKRLLRQWAEEAAGELPSVKAAAMKYGDMKREYVHLDYSKRYGFDNLLEMGNLWPYQFWFTRSMVNWALRFMDRPGILAQFAKLANFTNDELDEDLKGMIPSRMKGKLRIPMAWLPDWMGDAIYIDPLGKLFPPRDFLRSWERYGQEQTRVRRKTEQLLMEWVDAGRITKAQYEAALDDPEDALWVKASEEAKTLEGGDAYDFLSLVSGPGLLWQFITRGPEGVNQLPMSRSLQALANITGWDGLKMFDFQAQLRKSAGLSEYGEWGNYYAERQLANLAADGEITTAEAIEGMIEHKGDAWDKAMERVQQEMTAGTGGALPLMALKAMFKGDASWLDVIGSALIGWMPGGLLPEGELKLRGLYDEYQQAWQEYHAGDEEAVNTFFEDHPEYRARLALFEEDPEMRLKQYMKNNIWEAIGNMTDLEKRTYADQLGDDFQEYFLNSETRDYDAISLERMAEWAKALGTYAPEGTQSIPYQAPTPSSEELYQSYLDEGERLYPGAGELSKKYFGIDDQDQKDMYLIANPIVQQYLDWQSQYVVLNPELIPLLASMNSKISGETYATQYAYYMYYGEKARLFPNISATWDQYWAMPTDQRKSFWKQHPELGQYGDWQEEYLASYPEVAPFVASQEKAMKAMFGENYTDKWGKPTDVTTFPMELQGALRNYFRYNEALSAGAERYAYLEWEDAGRPFASFERWLESLGVFY